MPSDRYPRAAAYLVAVIVAASFADDLLRIPVQISDSLSQLLNVQQTPSALATFAAWVQQGAYLRPVFWVEVDVLFDLAHGHYWLAYRGFHALLLFAAVLLFTRALRVRTWTDFAAAVFALTCSRACIPFAGPSEKPLSCLLQC